MVCCEQVRGKDAQQTTEDLHKQLIEAEAFRLQVPLLHVVSENVRIVSSQHFVAPPLSNCNR